MSRLRDVTDKHRKAFLSVMVGTAAPAGNDMKHVTYVQEKIDLAFMVRSVNALRAALDSDRRVIFDALTED